LLVDSPFKELAVASAIVVPMVLSQDSVRYWHISRQSYWLCSLIDIVSLLGTTAVIVAATIYPLGNTAFVILLAWGVGAAIGALVGMGTNRCIPSLWEGIEWFSSNKETALYLSGATASQQASGRVSQVLVRVLAGAEALGQISASRTILMPLNTLVSSSASFALPEAVSRLRSGIDKLDQFVRIFSLVIAAVIVAAVAGIWFIPDSVGHLIAGTNWSVAHSLIVPTGAWILGIGISQGPRAGIRALGGSKEMLTLSLILGAVMTLCAVIGALVSGGTGAAWGFGLASLAGQFLWIRTYRRLRLRFDQTHLEG
jgi:O-antigen/teichoic acid export membrane protein